MKFITAIFARLRFIVAPAPAHRYPTDRRTRRRFEKTPLVSIGQGDSKRFIAAD